MARFSIISKDGTTVRYEGCPKYTGTYLNVPYLDFASIESPYPIEWEVGDFVTYHRTGLTYRLYTIPEPKKQARKGTHGAAFVYTNVKFYSAVKDLEIAQFRDLVPEDNDIHFSTRPDVNTFENVHGIASRIQECMNDIFPGKWEIRVYDTSDADLKALFNEAREFSVSNGTCIDALSQIYEVWKNVGWTHTYENGKEVITIGRTSLRDSSNTSDAFAYGVGKGLTSIKKAALNAEEFATRLYVYGSDRNIQTRYYNGLNIHDKESVDIRNLMIPIDKWGKTDGLPDARKAFLQADDSIIEKYGLIPRTVYFDGTDNEEIYPSITGLTEADVRRYMLDAGLSDSSLLPDNTTKRIDKCRMTYLPTDEGDKESVEAHRTWKMGVHGLGFNVFEQGKLAANGEAVISMKSGACAGREFTVKSSIHKIDGQELTLERVWDESIGMGYPNSIYKILPGDQFVILDIPMPEFYITAAQDKLYEAAQNLLDDYTKVSAFYEPAVDSIKLKEGGKLLREGMYMEVYDEDVINTADHKDYVLIDTLSIDEKGELPKYQVTLREQKRASRTFGTLEEMIEDTKRDTAEKIDRQRQYTDRRFRSAQETIEMLKGAFSNFSDGITPVSVQTMSLLVGDISLQYKFTASRTSLDDVPCPLSYDNATKQFKAVEAALIHMTLGIDSVTSSRTRVASEYLSWMMPEWYSPQFEEAAKRYYVYARVPKNGTTGSYVFSETVVSLEAEPEYYHLLIGILNSEFDGARDFITLYGFTEVLPGQITTDVIRDGSSNLVIDLINATITAKNGAKIIGDVQFGTGSTGLANLEEWQSLQSEVGGLGVSIEKVQDQIDGVVENWNGEGTPTLANEPAATWIEKGDAELIAHINDTYINIEKYENDEDTPTAGHAWRWCQCTDNSITDFVEVEDKDGNTLKLHWHPIADSDAVRALREAAEAKESATPLNLLAKSAEVLSWESEWTHIRIPLPIRVNAGEKYTFKCEKSMLLTGTHTGYIIKLDAKDDDSAALTPWYGVDFGENNVVVMEVYDGVSDSVAMLTILKQSYPDSFENKARFQNVSLVKGTTAMPMWQDYQGDNGLKNILDIGREETLAGTGTYSHMQLFMSYPFKAGEQYTIMCEEATISSGDEYEILLYTQDNTGAVTGYYGQFVMKTGNYQYLTVTMPKDTPDSYIFGIYSGRLGAANKTLKLTGFSMVKGTRPMMVWKENTDYLTNAFKNGTTKISGGLVMAQAVAVTNDAGTVKGMFNGSETFNDVTHGTLMLAAGSEGASASQLNSAKTRIYEDGHVVSNSMELKEGCKVAGSIEVTEEGLKVDNASRSGYLTIDDGGVTAFDADSVPYASVGNCAGAAVQGIGKGGIGSCPREDFQVGIHGSSAPTKAAFFCDRGQFYGLRPRIRDLSSGGNLNNLDHTVWALSGTINLPQNDSGVGDGVSEGQTYKIIHYSTDKITITPLSGKMMSLKGKDGVETYDSITSTEAEVIEMWFGGENWYYVRHSN